ncbi:MAG: alpha/beta hydrolase [Planctomycetes bacterium]|nr:alpha/beta hydrolase [Planctomycetota bacterium]
MKAYENLEYAHRGGRPLCLDLFVPAKAEAPVPLLMGIPGGGWRVSERAAIPPFMIEDGFAMARIDYRVKDGEIGPANIHDCKTALRFLKSSAGRYGLDASRVGIFGASAGGHLAALMGTSIGVAELEGPDHVGFGSDVQAVCAVCGPSEAEPSGPGAS